MWYYYFLLLMRKNLNTTFSCSNIGISCFAGQAADEGTSLMMPRHRLENIFNIWGVSVKENSFTTQGGAGFALQVGFQTPEMIGPRTMNWVAGSLQHL
jgi:hypothetical protein